MKYGVGIDITAKYVHSLPMYIDYQNKRRQNKSDDKADNDIQSLELTKGQIHNWFDKQKENLSDALLTKLRETDPFVFEHMMIELMTRMVHLFMCGLISGWQRFILTMRKL